MSKLLLDMCQAKVEEQAKRIVELEAQCAAMRKALRRIEAELGCPTGSYPQPVVNAYHITQEALASDAGKGLLSPKDHREVILKNNWVSVEEHNSVVQLLQKVQANAACPLCKGTGAAKENPCLCGGSGKAIDAFNACQNSHQNLEIQVRDLQAKVAAIAKLEAVRDAAEAVAYWLTRRGVADSEFRKLRAALDALE